MAFKERCEWATRGLQDNDVAQAKLTLDELRGFVERWHQYPGDELLEKALEDLCANALEIELRLESCYRSALRHLIERRLLLLAEQGAFRNALAWLKIIKMTPEDAQTAQEKMFRACQQEELDLEQFYRASERKLDERENDFKNALTGFQVDWPERMTDEVRRRLSDWKPELLKGWTSDL